VRLPPLVGAGGTLLSERPKLKLAADKGEPNTMDTQTDCLLIGTAVADVLIRPVPLTQPVGGGRLLHAEPLVVTTGGLVCNTGVAMRRLGMRVAWSGRTSGRPPFVRACHARGLIPPVSRPGRASPPVARRC
jgi:hypothetical protein